MTHIPADRQKRSRREKVSIPCVFGLSDDTPRKGTVTSLSLQRCFVKSKAWAKDGMEMHIKLWLPNQRWLSLRSTVLYCLEKIGFELYFNDPTPEVVEALNNLIEAARSGRAPLVEVGDPPEEQNDTGEHAPDEG